MRIRAFVGGGGGGGGGGDDAQLSTFSYFVFMQA